MASTVLISHQGGTNPTQAPVKWLVVGANSNVIGSSYMDGDRAVWRVEDPGFATGTNSKGAGLYYEAKYEPAQRDMLHTQGWELNARVKIPGSDPTTGTAWNADSNAWVGYAYNFPVATGEPVHRAVFAFMFGRAANGTTNVQVYGGEVSGLRNVLGDYHDYSIQFNPLTQKASFYIDGVFIMEHGGVVTTSTADSRLYWGDNSNQGSAGPHRAAYYESIVFSMVPEPSRLLLIGVASGAVLLRRRRR